MTEQEWLTAADSRSMLSYLASRIDHRKYFLIKCAFLRRFWHLLTDERSCRAIEVAERHADGLVSTREWARTRSDAQAAFRSLTEELASKQLSGLVRYRGCQSASFHASLSISLSHSFSISHLSEIATATLPLRSRRFPPHFLEELQRIRSLSAEERLQEAMQLCEQVSNQARQRVEADQAADHTALTIERTVQSELLRDLFGNPFRPVSVQPSWATWNNRTVLRLAHAAYKDRISPRGILDNNRLAILADALEEAGCEDEAILTHFRAGGEHVRGCAVLDALLGKE